jgi:hypothetical protein
MRLTEPSCRSELARDGISVEIDVSDTPSRASSLLQKIVEFCCGIVPRQKGVKNSLGRRAIRVISKLSEKNLN